MSSIAHRSRRTIDIWPGYVDALAAMLMVLIFVLLVFVIAQAMLSRTVSMQDLELATLHREIAELTRQLGLADEENEALQGKTNALSALISELIGEKEELNARFEQLSSANSGLEAQLVARDQILAALQDDLGGLRAARAALETESAAMATRLEQTETALAQRGVELDEERLISAAARAELALLNRQVLELRRRLEEIAIALAAAEAAKQDQAAEIEDLGKRLNVALAREVNRLSRYQSEFFGRLREVLGESPDIRVVGDRFVLSSELLFSSGTADLGEAGRQQLLRLAGTLRDLAGRIPDDLDWVLRVDGHTDRVPIRNARYASNWELSTARAVEVVRFLIEQRIPPRRLVAAGFGEHHPLDPGRTPQALARNRRIELKLTSR